ncbi:DUF3089 domain-containing protein [Pseudodesulfovibrio senegalensis]|uniref:DUF3089 domain-containing protein n=1 Tax=Pseudodesulfovibrio senegalensis TaxID=1721087 RepID=UPI0030C828CC
MPNVRVIIVVSLFCILSTAPIGAADNDNCCEIPACADYSADNAWASRPAQPNKRADVFYVYPTIYSDKSPKNMDVFDKRLRREVQGLLKSQAGAFSPAANLFAPYYRQLSFPNLDSQKDKFHNTYFRIGMDDVHRAFDYYLAFLNQGRPFILAGHSQGAIILVDLLRRRFHDPVLQEKLVAAYVIGYSVTREDLKKYPWIKPAQRADDTGVVVSWNTEAPGCSGSPVLLPGAVSINPLNWKTDGTPADKNLNLGAVFFDDLTGAIKREVPHYTGAYLDTKTRALMTSPPEKLDLGRFPPGVLHKYDFALWYRNIERNAQDRIEAYLQKH